MKNKNLILFIQYCCAFVLVTAFGLAVYIQFFYSEIPKGKDSGLSSHMANSEKRLIKFGEDVIIPEVIDSFNLIKSQPIHIKKSSAINRDSRHDEIENECILRFDTFKDMQKFSDTVGEKGFEVLNTIDKWNSIRIKVNNKDTLADLHNHLPRSAEYSPNYYVRIPNHPETSPGDNSSRVTKNSYTPFKNSALSWLDADETNLGSGTGVIVAVLDSGVTDHTAFENTTITEIDLIAESMNSLTDTSALTTESGVNGHGTAVASIIVGNSASSPGVASDAELLSVRVLDANGIGDVFSVAQGIIEAVDAGANVVNMSLGTYASSWVLEEAVNYALENNVALVAAVGNEGVKGIAYPAKYEGVIAVSAVDASEQHTSFSNRGPEVDIAAPGVRVYAAWLDDQIVSFSGTSAAAPYVTGTLASLLSSDPGLTITEAIEIILTYSNDAGAPGIDPEFGHGILNIGRIQDRNKGGIRDIAVSGFFLDQEITNDGDLLQLNLSVQNRGTEWLSRVYVAVYTDSSEEIYEFLNIKVGETASQSIDVGLDRLETKDEIKIYSMASIDGWRDSNPENNYRSFVLRSSAHEDNKH